MRLSEVVHGDGKTLYRYSPNTGFPGQVIHTEPDLEYRWDYQFTGGLLTEERIDFGAKTGLSSAKFTYEYDGNYRLISAQGRIGGQNLPQHTLAYNSKTGSPEIIGGFTVSKSKQNETSLYDRTALFSRVVDTRFLETQVTLTIHGLEVFRMEFSHDMHG